MSVTILANQQMLLDEVVAALQKEGVSVAPVLFDNRMQVLPIDNTVTDVVLIVPEQGVVNVGEKASIVRKLIGSELPLIVCTPQPAEKGRQALRQCGASEVITPRSWIAGHVAERVLAELILKGRLQPSEFGLLRGATRVMRSLYKHIETIAPLTDAVLILGESGTGKELVAKEIHRQSGLTEPMLAINCAELSQELLGSELFGHERGAFTGALQSRTGLLVAAKTGTVFLDEIGDMSPVAQAQMLRVIEERKVRPVGANTWQNFQARLVLATHRDLGQASVEGRFRHDLYQRICGFTLKLPPLRERRADLPLLAHHFVQEYCEERKVDIWLTSDVLDGLFNYEWPGNVRELRGVMRRAAAYANQNGHINPAVLQESLRYRGASQTRHSIQFDPATDSWRDFLRRAQMQYFQAILSQAGGNKEQAAKLAGLSRSQFYEKLKETDRHH